MDDVQSADCRLIKIRRLQRDEQITEFMKTVNDAKGCQPLNAARKFQT